MMVKQDTQKIHIALAVSDLETSMAYYTQMLGIAPVACVAETYALWRTEIMNLSLTQNPEQAGIIRHLGFERPDAPKMTAQQDPDGVVWEDFSQDQQREEIFALWPHAHYPK